jgi:hydroxymethylpyrimidine pyrophosphatase-like HAD family hydrolase
MSIQLLALDLDGTLLNSRGEISASNRRAIAMARARGVRVALVTGRRFRDARPVALELGLDVPVIAHNGALTKHARTLETVAAWLLPLEAAREVLSVGRAHRADPLVSDDPAGPGLLLYDHLSDDNVPLQKYIAWARRIAGGEADVFVRRVPSLEAYLDHPPVHISFSGDCAAMDRLSGDLAASLGQRVQVMSTIYPRLDFTLLDILHPAASKGAGLAAVASEYGVAREDVMAIGDNFNDLEMLRYAGTSVVMGNADSRLREMDGFHVTTSNDESGVAAAIERFILDVSG